jgi:histidinol-phosphate/aromatic aminotransferase/cobyric acid decarboxylase-like protein/choline kinase
VTEVHAIVLAAGKGERLSPLTDISNKVLLEVGGCSVIERVLCTLEEAGVAGVTVVTGHCAALVEAHVRGRSGNLPVSFAYNPDYASSNNIVSLAVGLGALPTGMPLLLVEGDLIMSPALIRRMLEAGSDAALVERFRAGLDGTLVAVEHGMVTRMIMGDELHALNDRFHYSKTVNVTLLSARTVDDHVRPALSSWIEGGSVDEYYEAVFAELVASGAIELGAIDVGTETWVEIDDAQDLDRARFIYDPSGRRQTLDRSFGGYWNYPVLDYAYPQNCHFPTPAVYQELAALMPSIIGRYGSSQAVLDHKLSRFLRCSTDQVVMLNGLSQIYPWLSQIYGDINALVPRPCFGEYSRIWPGASTYEDSGEFCWESIYNKTEQCDIIVIVNPNNPTGTFTASDHIVKFASENPDKIIVVDESFMDFSGEPSLEDVCAGRLPANILLLKSLGKALGVSGLRLGYVRSSRPDVIEGIRKMLPIWNCNSLAEAFLEILPKQRRAIAMSLSQTRDDRSAMQSALAQLPIVAEIKSSAANFLLVRLNLALQDLDGFLDRLVERHGIYAKNVSERVHPAAAWLRLSVRTLADNERLYAALDDESDRPAASSASIHR